MKMSLSLCFFTNPIAGLGGPLGLKGSDGIDIDLAKANIQSSPSINKAKRFLHKLWNLGVLDKIHIYIAPKYMGWDIVKGVGYHKKFTVIDLETGFIDGYISTAAHTYEFIDKALDIECSIIAFVGGDGTARNILEVYLKNPYRRKIPVIGIPAGVKVYSGVFALSPEAASLIIMHKLYGKASVDFREVIDVDEELLRKGKLVYKVYGELPTIIYKALIQEAKDFRYMGDVDDIARYFTEEYYDPNRDILYIFGPGRTLYNLAYKLGVKKSLFGFDAVYLGRIVGYDLSSKDLVNVLNMYRDIKRFLILTPIAGSRFIIGRATGQLTAEVLRFFSRNDIIIIAPEWKIGGEVLYIDSGDPETDRRFEGYYRVLTGYREEKILKIICTGCINA